MPILVRTPLQTFTLVSLGLIMLMVMGVGYVQSIFLRNAILDREGVIVRDVVQAVVSQQISFNDLVRFREPGVQMYFERSFTVLNNLSEVVRMKIYNRHGVLVWSDDPLLIGRRVAGDPEVEHALTGGMESQFYSGEIVEYAEENLPPIPVVEF